MFEISHDPGTGGQIAVDPETQRKVLVLPDGAARLFKRRAMKIPPAGPQQEVCWLVAELDGVRTYIDGDQIVVTRKELYP